MNQEVTSKPRNLTLIFAVISALYFLSQFYRVSNAVIAPNLVRDLRLNAETLGILGGAFFYSFALLQIPMGPMLDRIGPRLVMFYFALLSAVGSFLFAIAESFGTGLVGRILIGVGMAPILMGSLKVFVVRFPGEKFATLVGMVVSVGTLGNIFAMSPLAYLSSTVGWRAVFLIAGAMAALFAIVSFWILGGNTKPDTSSPSPDAIGILRSVGMILKTLSFWQIGFLGLFRYGTFVGLQGLWLGPYLMDIKGYSPVQAGNMLIVLGVGTMIGGPVAGRLSDQVLQSRKWVTFWGITLYSLTLLPLTGILEIGNPLVYVLIFFFMGFFCGFGLLVFSHAKELFPSTMSGTVMTFINFLSMTGAALFMPAVGRLIEAYPRTGEAYPPEAYHFSFLICFLGIAASLIFYAFSKRK